MIVWKSDFSLGNALVSFVDKLLSSRSFSVDKSLIIFYTAGDFSVPLGLLRENLEA